MQSITLYQAMRMIVSAKKSIIGVTFTKTDGTRRIMALRRNTIFGVKGDAASDQAKQARRTRKKKHPHLVSVLELKKGTPQWRTLNLKTLSGLRVNGRTLKVGRT